MNIMFVHDIKFATNGPCIIYLHLFILKKYTNTKSLVLQ